MLTEVSREICEDLYFSVWILLGWILLSFSASSAIPYYLINHFQVGIDEQFDDLISELCSRSAHAEQYPISYSYIDTSSDFKPL